MANPLTRRLRATLGGKGGAQAPGEGVLFILRVSQSDMTSYGESTYTLLALKHSIYITNVKSHLSSNLKR
jgi:hypothetical protein